MLVNIAHDTRAEHRRLLYAGVAFMLTVSLLIAFSIAIYQKVFTRVTTVTVKADRAGLQLPKFGDVRIHGVLVGQIRSVRQDGSQAVIKLGLEPGAARNIPDNVSVEIRPTTLFGQKYVSLIDPADPSSQPLRNGSVIPASRVTTNVELQQVLANLFPLLRSIRPADLNTTLYALATALQGRGEKLGQTVEQLDSYLGAMNEQLPTLRKDLELLADVSNTYALAAPDLVDLLRNATTTARTVSEKSEQLSGFFTDLTAVSGTARDILARNGDDIVEESRLAAPLTSLLDTYSPEYPCLLKGLTQQDARLQQVFAGGSLHITLSVVIPRAPYTPSEVPRYEAHSGPNCAGLPNPSVPAPPVTIPDGTSSAPPSGHGASNSSSLVSLTSGLAGTAPEQHVVDALLAPVMGVSPDQVPPVATLLFAPLARGTAVSVS